MIDIKTIDEKKIGINPFTQSLKIPCTKTYSKDEYVSDENVMVNKMFFIEREKKTLLFHGKQNMSATLMLSHRALQLYLWVALHLNHNKDYILINKRLFMLNAGIKSDNTYRAAIDELVRYGFVTGTVLKAVYWINPAVFFCGNRLSKYPANKEVKAIWD